MPLRNDKDEKSSCKRFPMSICYNVPLYLITIILLWSYYVFAYLYCITYLVTVAYKIILLVFYNIFFLVFMWCLWATALIKMYEVPFQYQVSARDHMILLQLKEADRHRILAEVCTRTGLRIYTRGPSGYLRYCTVCQHLKPDRTHHCSVCGKCVLKMDHHCPFVNNCIGLANYKHFVLMLFYGFLYTLFYFSSTFPFLLQFCLDPSLRNNYIHVQIVAACFLGVLFWVLFVAFGCFHLSMIWKNETTLESLKEPVFVDANFTFNIGIKMNFRAAFGDNLWLWWLPRRVSDEGGGVQFPITRKVDSYALNSFITYTHSV